MNRLSVEVKDHNYLVSAHAKVRMQQRGISSEVLKIILSFGNRAKCREGWTYSLNHAGRERARNMLRGKYSQLGRKLDTYVIVDEQEKSIITAARRDKRYYTKTAYFSRRKVLSPLNA